MAHVHQPRIRRPSLGSTAGTLLIASMMAIMIGVVGGCAARQKAAPPKADTSARDAADAAFAESAKQPPNAKTMYAMAKILVGQGRDRDAAALLNRIVQQHPTFLPAYNELAGVYFRAARLNDAIAVLGAGLKRGPSDAVLLNNLGMCRLAQKDYEGALDSFELASKAVPDNAVYKANVAVALGLLGRNGEASNAYDGVVTPHTADWNLTVLSKARQGARAGTRANPPAPPEAAAGQ